MLQADSVRLRVKIRLKIGHWKRCTSKVSLAQYALDGCVIDLRSQMRAAHVGHLAVNSDPGPAMHAGHCFLLLQRWRTAKCQGGAVFVVSTTNDLHAGEKAVDLLDIVLAEIDLHHVLSYSFRRGRPWNWYDSWHAGLFALRSDPGKAWISCQACTPSSSPAPQSGSRAQDSCRSSQGRT